MKVALVQMKSGPHKAVNVARALQFARDAIARRATLVMFPEYFNYRGPLDRAVLSGLVERIPGPSTLPFLELARRHRVYVLIGSLYEKARGSEKAYNTSVLINPQGQLQAVYRKQHLFHVCLPGKKINEADFFKPGRRSVVTALGGFSLGMAVCFDVRFPLLFEGYARRGAQVFSVPAAFSYETGRAHWKTLLRARAVETFSYVLAPNQAAPYWGHSMAVSPWGEVLAEASGDREEVIYAGIDRARVAVTRRGFPDYKK
jgi:deaminated glutathione amidase